jgi:SHS2 domain-containing protein
MATHGYEEVDHTADVAIRVWGEDFQALLRQAAEGLYDLMSVERMSNSPAEVHFELQQGTNEDILVDFLNELLYLSDEKKQIFKEFSFADNEDRFEIQAEGYQILSQDRQIKAVTFHNLNIEKTHHGFETIITFDV